MARGWESKSVEEQISAHEAESQKSAKKHLSRRDRERQAKQDSLQLARARTITALQTSRDPRYRAQLEGALAHLDSELANLENTD